MKFDVRCDRGTFTGTLPFESYDVITPLFLTINNFEDQKRSLKGFSESIAAGCTIHYGTTPTVVSSSGYSTVGGETESESRLIMKTAITNLRCLIDVFCLPSSPEEENNTGSCSVDTARLAGCCCLKASKNGPMKESTVLITLQIER